MTRPQKRLTAAPIACSTSAYFRTSARSASIASGPAPPARPSLSRASARCDSLRPVIATLTPSAASACAMAKPMPREPPVTTAVCPRSDCMGIAISHRMREVAIVGAGELGGLVAHALARRNSAGLVRPIDDSGRVAEGKSLEISQAAPVEGFATAVAGSTDLSAAAGAEIVVIADRAGSLGNDLWQGEESLTLVRQLNAIAPRAFLLCAGVFHREL